MATCPNTGITIPECSCNRCLEDQVRRYRPVLLKDAGEPARRRSGPPAPAATRPRAA